MKTILAILVKAGGWRPDLYLKIENPPYMELVFSPPRSGQNVVTVFRQRKGTGDQNPIDGVC